MNSFAFECEIKRQLARTIRRTKYVTVFMNVLHLNVKWCKKIVMIDVMIKVLSSFFKNWNSTQNERFVDSFEALGSFGWKNIYSTIWDIIYRFIGYARLVSFNFSLLHIFCNRSTTFFEADWALQRHPYAIIDPKSDSVMLSWWFKP